jgi:hypothetical protein
VTIHPRVAWQVLDGQAVLIDLERGVALGLNQAASFLWPRLDGRDEDALAEALASEFDVGPERARADVAAFVSWLRSRGFLES